MPPDVRVMPLGIAISFAELRASIDWAQRSVTVYGKVYPQPRLTRWYGDVPYVYSGLSWEASPMPALLQTIRQHVEALTGETFNSVLCNLYRDGRDSVGFHADDEPIFGGDPIVASVSFGAGRTFAVRANKGKERHSYLLQDGQLLVMGRGVQTGWKHSLLKSAEPVGERINLTYRRTV
jgi:alkylated DNA repair dioxygenase AlkB